jgi:hypothetical protein
LENPEEMDKFTKIEPRQYFKNLNRLITRNEIDPEFKSPKRIWHGDVC